MIRLLSLPVLAALAAPLLAQSPVPIEDATSSAVTTGRSASSSYSGATVTPISQAAANNADMLYTLQLLQQEVQQLRGMVEQQAYQIKQMEEEQRDRYLDLDRRLSMQGGSGSGSATAQQPTQNSYSGNSAASSQPAYSAAASSSVSADDDRDAYQAAFELIRNKDYQAAVNALMRFTQTYPDSSYTGNAYYWLGEVQLVQGSNEDALQTFGLLLNRFPDHRKVPDAKYKLGKVYRTLGDEAKAKAYFNEVVKQYPDSSAAKLASSELAK